MVLVCGTWRSDGCAVGPSGAVAAEGQEAGTSADMDRRQLIDGIRWRTRTGTPWRDVPERDRPWGRVYDLFRRWQRDSTWQRIFAELQAQADVEGLITWDISVDSTVCRAHQHAAEARKRGPCRSSRRAVSPSSPTTTGSGVRVAA